MTSSDYVRPPAAKRPRTVLLCLACLVVGALVGGLGVWAALPPDDGATETSALGVGAPDESLATIVPTTIVAAPETTVPPSPHADLLQRCNTPETPQPAVATLEEFRALIVRTWMLCSETSVFGTRDETGLELVADGTWFKLYGEDDGTSTRGRGFDRQGTWEIIPIGGMTGRTTFQINLSVFGSGTVITSPVFTGEPTKMRMNNMSVHIADYVAVDSK